MMGTKGTMVIIQGHLEMPTEPSLRTNLVIILLLHILRIITAIPKGLLALSNILFCKTAVPPRPFKDLELCTYDQRGRVVRAKSYTDHEHRKIYWYLFRPLPTFYKWTITVIESYENNLIIVPVHRPEISFAIAEQLKSNGSWQSDTLNLLLDLSREIQKAPEGDLELGDMHRQCFVTVGATADFKELLAAAVSPEILQSLADKDFTHLTLQVGDLYSYFMETKPTDTKGLNLQYFAFNANGLREEMSNCKAKKDVSHEGLVISHAGKR